MILSILWQMQIIVILAYLKDGIANQVHQILKVTQKYNADGQIYSLTLEQNTLPIADQQVK